MYNAPGLFGSVGPNPPYTVRYDLSMNNVIDLADVLVFNIPGLFGSTCTTP